MRTLVLVATLLMAGSTAIAAPLTAEQREQARKHYDSANRKFDLGKYDEAAAEFETVYEISGDPSQLFDVAQAMRLARNYEKALQFYRSYLRRAPDAKNRALVEKRLAEMAQLVEQQKNVSNAPPQGTLTDDKPSKPVEPAPAPEPAATMVWAPPVGATPPAAPAPERVPSRGLRRAGFALAACTVASLAVGVTLSVLASSANGDITRADQTRNTPWTPALADEDAKARTYDAAAIAAYVGAGAFAVASAVTLALGYRHRSELRAARMTPIVGRGVAGLGLGGAF